MKETDGGSARRLSAYLLLMPLLVILASHLLFLETDNDTRKNLLTIPVLGVRAGGGKASAPSAVFGYLYGGGRSALPDHPSAAGLCTRSILKLFGVGLLESVLMWTGALPCILLVTALNKSYIISVIITFFYTMSDYLIPDRFLINTAVWLKPRYAAARTADLPVALPVLFSKRSKCGACRSLDRLSPSF